MRTSHLLIFAVIVCLAPGALAQDETTMPEKSFTIVKEMYRTPVLSQGSTGTCWSFSAVSFIESELQRMGKGEIDLSEMFVVYQTYLDKADYYIRMHGNNTFGQGAHLWDTFRIMQLDGAMPAAEYDGLWTGEERYSHGELERGMKAFLDAVLKSRNGPSMKWSSGLKGILDAYLGTPPEEFSWNGKTWTAKTFAEHINIDPDEYILLTSFMHMPYWEAGELLVPDNWFHHDEYYNLPLDQFMQTFHHALENGYTVAFASDVSEEMFSQKTGYAILERDVDAVEIVTPEEREEMWNSWKTTDDHGMHAVGIAADDQHSEIYYIVKNSWGADPEETGPYNGHVYMHENFMRAKLESYLIHKDAVPAEILRKLGL